VADKKEQLADWDVKEQANPESKELGPLEKLQAMLKEEQDGQVEDFADMLEDLFEDEEEMQASFREAVEQLTKAHQPTAADEPGGGKNDEGKTARETLLAMLPAAEQEVRIAELEESVAQKDEELAAKDKELASLRDGDDSVTTEGATGAAVETDESESLRAQMAAKDAELTAKDAELARVKEELASLRALLPPPAPSEEDVPPYS
jgi:hypothetical protein